MTWTINGIQAAVMGSGSHWFDRDTLRWFRCRVGEKVYQGPGGVYFVTSEKGPFEHSKRAYTVRQFHPQDNGIDTVGEFNELTRAAAHSQAAELAATPLDQQFTRAMLALDLAVTGANKKNHRTQYGTAAEAAAGAVLYLSDGGYTRCKAGEYDGGGFYLELIQTGTTDRRGEWSDAYKLQAEVCRVLKTEPAGDVATIAEEIHKPETDADALARAINQNGGTCSVSHANRLIRLATRHDRMMCDYCNGKEVYRADGEPKKPLADLIRQIEEAALMCGTTAQFQGDPRGCTVKLILPSGASNNLGGEAWGVPTRG